MIAVVDAGSGNLRSVEKAIAVAGGAPVVTRDPDVVRRADRVVVPGQGAFRDCMNGLRSRGLDQAVRESIRGGKPYLGICLGMQVLFEESDEHGPCAGLGIFPGRVKRFDAPGLKVPHMGWNDVQPTGRYFYFVHSYYAVPAREELVALWCDYGGRFCAAVRHENVLATQFHPEKSQAAGLELLRGFVDS